MCRTAVLRTQDSAADRLQQTPQQTYYADLDAYCSSGPTAADLYVLLVSAAAYCCS